MRIKFLFILSLFVIQFSFAQSCLPSGITFTAQSQIDSFSINYPGCTVIEGDVTINEYVSNFNGLNAISSIQGNFNVENNSTLLHMTGLENLTEIGGNFFINSTWNLIDFQGLESLESIGGDMTVSNNFDLENMLGLQSLSSVGGKLDIDDNRILVQIDLTSLTHIGGLLRIFENDDLVSLGGLQNLNSLGGSLTVTENPLLSNFTASENLTRINGNVLINNNANLNNLNGLQNITAVEGDFTISANNSMSMTVGIGSLDSIYGALWVNNNQSLSTITIFNNLTYLEGAMYLLNNASLSSVEPFSNLDHSGYIQIRDCNTLTNLNGFENLSHLNYLIIQDNNSLANLEGLNNLSSTGGLSIISNPNLLSLAALGNLTSTASLNINSNGSLINLEGLGSLTTINGSFTLDNNASLSEISDLSNLTSIGDFFIIDDNSSLVNLTGLEGITYLPEHFLIKDNESLVSLTGLENLEIAEGYFLIENNDNLINMQGLNGLSYGGGGFFIEYNDGLLNLEGLENFTSLYGGDLNIKLNSNLQTLDGLDNLADLGFGIWLLSNTNLESMESLSALTNLGGDLKIEANHSLTSINAIPLLNSIGGLVRISNNDNLGSFDALNSLTSVGGKFTIYDNPLLTNLNGLENLETIGDQFILGELEALGNLSNFQSLSTIGSRLDISGLDSLFNLTGLDSIQFLTDDIRIAGNAQLTSLFGLHNADLTNATELKIISNPNLSICSMPSVCAFLANGGDSDISNNLPGCSDEDEILDVCQGYSKILFPLYYDVNENAVKDSIDIFYQVASVNIEPLGLTVYGNSINGGYYYLPNGDYTISYNQANTPNWGLTTDSISYSISVSDTTTVDTLHFGLNPILDISETNAHIASGNMRCNSPVTFFISAYNLGTTISNGLILFEVDPAVLGTTYIDTPDTIISPNTYGWFFENLYPGNAIQKAIFLDIPGPPDFPVGNELLFESQVFSNDINGPSISNLFQYKPIVLCSFDPNDKLVSPLYPGNLSLQNEDLIYTVRFQNTGNAEAYRVVIRDTLDANLDPSTFSFISSSHEEVLTTSMTDNQFLTFDFNDIFLPDSTSNYEGSQGYVSYKIRPYENLPEETEINNTASIYFDFNPPVVTNTTENILLSTFDFDNDGSLIWDDCDDQNPNAYPGAIEIINNDIDEDCDGEDLVVGIESLTQVPPKVFPNPTTAYLEVQLNDLAVAKISIKDARGRLLLEKNIEGDGDLDLSSFPDGIYLLSIKTTLGVWTQKLVKVTQ